MGDTTIVTAAGNGGFEYSGANITSGVVVDDGVGTGVGQVELTLDAAAGGTLSYAYNNAEVDVRIGPTAGPRGNIRDSDPLVTENDGTPMYNWLCVDVWEVA